MQWSVFEYIYYERFSLMQSLKTSIIEHLSELKDEHCLNGLKIEFETEFLNAENVCFIKELKNTLGLPLVVKIGGCGCVNDICSAKELGADGIIAPMIESGYALRKFVSTVEDIYNCQISGVDLLINIETEKGVQNLGEILSDKKAEFLKGIIFGRNDFARSTGLKQSDVESEDVFNAVFDVCEKLINNPKELIIGGNVSLESIENLKKIPRSLLKKFETRKIVFDAALLDDEKSAERAILKAIDFELLWLEYKLISNPNETDKNRLEFLRNKKIKQKICSF